MGMRNLCEAPSSSLFPSKKELKVAYWNTVAHLSPSQSGCSLTTDFLNFKLTLYLEPYWDVIRNTLDRKLYHQFRVGSLPVGFFTMRWKKDQEGSCPFCPEVSETVAHFFFVCPYYRRPRHKWLKPICKSIDIRAAKPALRVLRSNTEEAIVVAVAKLLGWAWVIRANALRTPQ